MSDPTRFNLELSPYDLSSLQTPAGRRWYGQRPNGRGRRPRRRQRASWCKSRESDRPELLACVDRQGTVTLTYPTLTSKKLLKQRRGSRTNYVGVHISREKQVDISMLICPERAQFSEPVNLKTPPQPGTSGTQTGGEVRKKESKGRSKAVRA